MSTATDRRDGAIRTRNKPIVPGAPFIPELDKAQPGGVATLDGTTSLVPSSQLGTGTPDATTALFGDQTFKAAATSASLAAETAARIAADSSEATTRASADSSEATTRASADTTEAAARVTHQNLTTTAHGGIVASTDTRLSDSRAPNGAAAGDLSGTYPNPTVAQATKLTTARAIGGVNFDGTAAITPGTAAKTVSTTMARDASGNTAVVGLTCDAFSRLDADGVTVTHLVGNTTTHGVGAAATVVSPYAPDFGVMVWISGNDGAGKLFSDLVIYTTNQFTVLHTGGVSGGAAARTYSVVGGQLKLSIAAGSYSISAVWIANGPKF